MNDIQITQLTADEIRAIEARAHELRAQAMAGMLRALGRGIAALPHKLAGLFHRPHHA
ncbi:RSP_7527 family protein [Roseobacteraceae bacterium NS-SX3]